MSYERFASQRFALSVLESRFVGGEKTFGGRSQFLTVASAGSVRAEMGQAAPSTFLPRFHTLGSEVAPEANVNESESTAPTAVLCESCAAGIVVLEEFR